MTTPQPKSATNVTPLPKNGEPSGSTLGELRAQVESIAAEFAEIAKKRAEDISDQAGAGISELKTRIKRNPTLSMGIAAGAGALIGFALVPRRAQRRSGWTQWTPVSRADLYEMADDLQHSIRRAASASAVPITNSLERVVNAVSSVDPKTTIAPAIDTARKWLSDIRSSAS